ncbi:TauD/TfdA family dioxygenase [Streptomyces sp. NRRL F-5755]|uniref:TauD/TfdA family dioxygenase n=1 Tax=Streptomyces sp. NRRL F-5755 TaxID=1519475 RepID=UPI000D149326|nr:TauD/TfdA family dioxygenase [Streptomyces sp. NRRL F-5755]
MAHRGRLPPAALRLLGPAVPAQPPAGRNPPGPARPGRPHRRGPGHAPGTALSDPPRHLAHARAEPGGRPARRTLRGDRRYGRHARTRRRPVRRPDDPYLRIDPAYMSPAPGDTAAQRASDTITALIEDGLHDVALDAGSLLIVDNYQAVHGRKPFVAAYDGRDRRLKRVNITRDLRRSRPARQSATSLLV